MEINIDDIKKLEKLANLKLTDERREKIGKNLSSILDYIGILQTANVTNTPKTFSASGLKNVTAEDSPVLADALTQSQALSNAHEKHNGMLKTEKVINK
ncbi:Asp-tRNA(Asn)/Glu-tRNA(Gln) amidotransferase subunit GatC [Patescibacteria group bacterium]|nr:Asp-tRNA(Asn)/Glu-tRNA(Gln) amidotransferase subunit GatC [Patescibacteria group bacterium]